MPFEIVSSEVLTACVAVALVAAVMAYAHHHRSHVQVTYRYLGDGKSPRTIHTLASTHFILGDIPERLKNAYRQYDWLLEFSLAFEGEPWAMRMPGHPGLIMFTTPEAVEDILIHQFDNFPKGISHNERLIGLFGAGLIASDGARWFHQRKAAAKFFSTNVLRTMMMENMQTNVNEVCAFIDKKMAEPDQRVDLKQLFLEFTLETFAEVGLGVDLECIGSAEQHAFHKALDLVAPIAKRRFRVPASVWKLERWLNVGQEAVLTQQMEIVKRWLREIIEKSLQKAHAATTSSGTTRIKSVVELFLEHGGEGTEGLEPQDLVDFMLTFVVVARDTTAYTLCWFFYVLSKNPEVELAIRSEMTSKLGIETIAFLTTEHIKTLTYLEATIREVLRLYPAAPFLAREAAQDTFVDGDVLVRKGQIVGMSAYAMARHPRVWGLDAAEFKPERWIDPVSGEITQVSPTKFLSFGAGQRTCLGINLAMLELRLVTANLLYRYELKIDGTNDGSYEVAPTLVMKHPLFATAKRRP